jgi:aminoglycoside phosphotransferase (APT) family kinase protein
VTPSVIVGEMGAAGWIAERDVDAELAARLIGERFPELRGAPVEPLGTGWDNNVFLVGGEWVFRFPRRSVAVPLLEREIVALPWLAPRLPLAVPEARYAAGPAEEFPWPFCGGRLVPGRELAEAGLGEDERVEAARQVGEFLRVLHDSDLPPVELAYDPLGRAVPAKRAGMARESLAELAAKGLWEPDPAVGKLLAEAADAPVPDGRVLSHGDLHVRHVMVDADGRATGVIDWGDMCVADPAVDLSVAYGVFRGRARAALLDAYGPVGEARETAARTLAVMICAVLAQYAAATGGRETLLAETLTGIRRAAS